MQYEIVTAESYSYQTSAEDLAVKVRQYIALGFAPIGGVDSIRDYDRFITSQALVKYDRPLPRANANTNTNTNANANTNTNASVNNNKRKINN